MSHWFLLKIKIKSKRLSSMDKCRDPSHMCSCTFLSPVRKCASSFLMSWNIDYSFKVLYEPFPSIKTPECLSQGTWTFRLECDCPGREEPKNTLVIFPLSQKTTSCPKGKLFSL